jgi:dTDP-4-dehydrorhamnose reductase
LPICPPPFITLEPERGVKLLLCGAGGQVGTELRRLDWPTGWEIVATDRPVLDIADRGAVEAAVARERPGIVINAAAYTAVDRAESEAAAAWAGNCDGPANLAGACRGAGIPLIHISTDYVFDGSKQGPYVEDDPVRPLGVYGESKEAGERAVRDGLPEHVMLRTAWIYSAHGHNFVKTMLRLAETHPSLRVVADQRGSPTSAADIAAAIAAVGARVAAGTAAWGTYHFAGAGEVSWHGFAEAIFAAAAPWRGAPPPVTPIATADYPTPARRPANSVLDCRRIIADYGIVPRPWQEALGDVVRDLYEQAPANG